RVPSSSSFNDTLATQLYTLSLHDALPILTENKSWVLSVYPRRNPSSSPPEHRSGRLRLEFQLLPTRCSRHPSRYVILRMIVYCRSESTRLNSSHVKISYAVFCLKKKKIIV